MVIMYGIATVLSGDGFVCLLEEHGRSHVHAPAEVQFHTLQCVLQASYPAIRPNNQKSLLEALTEVHLRRLDTADILHRRAVATIAIEATPEEVMLPKEPRTAASKEPRILDSLPSNLGVSCKACVMCRQGLQLVVVCTQ